MVKGNMLETPNGVDEEEPDGWPVRGSEVIILDGPTSTTYRIGFEDLVVELPRTIIKVTPVRLRHNALLNHQVSNRLNSMIVLRRSYFIELLRTNLA